MADKKISELNQVVEVGLNDMLLVVQDGTSKRASAQQLSNLLNVDLTLGELSDVSVSDIQDGQTILWDELANKYRPSDIPNAASINNVLDQIIAANTSIVNVVTSLTGVVTSISNVVGTYDAQIAAVSARVTSVNSFYSTVTSLTDARVTSLNNVVSVTNVNLTDLQDYVLVQIPPINAALESLAEETVTLGSRITSVMGEVTNLTSVELAARTSLVSSINTVSAAVTSVNTRLSNTSVALETRINNVSVAAIRNVVSLADTSISTGAGVNQFALSWDNPSNKFSLRNPVPDGDKGDITVSAGVWTIDNGVVSNSKLANNAVTSSIIANNAVTVSAVTDNTLTNAKLAQIPTARFKGRVTTGTGDVEDLTGTQATTLLDTFTTSLKGLAPASGGGTTNYLRADGTWASTSKTANFVSASGVSTDITGLPADINWIMLSFDGISTNGTSGLIVQIGDSGGIETTGYVSVTGTGTTYANSGIGFQVSPTTIAATNTRSGQVLLTRHPFGNNWMCSHNLGDWTNNTTSAGGGSKSLSATLDRIRITTLGGANTFDAGGISMAYGV